MGTYFETLFGLYALGALVAGLFFAGIAMLFFG